MLAGQELGAASRPSGVGRGRTSVTSRRLVDDRHDAQRPACAFPGELCRPPRMLRACRGGERRLPSRNALPSSVEAPLLSSVVVLRHARRRRHARRSHATLGQAERRRRRSCSSGSLTRERAMLGASADGWHRVLAVGGHHASEPHGHYGWLSPRRCDQSSGRRLHLSRRATSSPQPWLPSGSSALASEPPIARSRQGGIAFRLRRDEVQQSVALVRKDGVGAGASISVARASTLARRLHAR